MIQMRNAKMNETSSENEASYMYTSKCHSYVRMSTAAVSARVLLSVLFAADLRVYLRRIYQQLQINNGVVVRK